MRLENKNSDIKMKDKFRWQKVEKLWFLCLYIFLIIKIINYIFNSPTYIRENWMMEKYSEKYVQSNPRIDYLNILSWFLQCKMISWIWSERRKILNSLEDSWKGKFIELLFCLISSFGSWKNVPGTYIT